MVPQKTAMLGFTLLVFSHSGCGGSKKAIVDTDTEDVLPADPAETDTINDDMGPIDAMDAIEDTDVLFDVGVDIEDAFLDTIDIGDDGPCSTTAWQTYTATDTPIAVPDNDETGVQSTISVDDCDIEVNDIRVDVNISHPFIGDLRVKLKTPIGQEIYLHDRTGNVTDNIITTYPTATIPAQTICVLMPIPTSLGNWKLIVTDNGAGDTGTLNSWSILFNGIRGYCPYTRYNSTDTFPIAIPDWDTTGISSQIYVGDSGSIAGINVLVDVDHDWIGDIHISLESPAGGHILLYDGAGGPRTYLTTIFPLEVAPLDSLSTFHGTPMNGTWWLHVADTDPTLTGRLLLWALYIH
jgi:subtilisin-like proprotein convertase family protein